MGIRHISLFKCPFLNLLFLLFASVIIPRALNLIKVGDQANVAWMYANGIEARLPNPCDASFAAAFVRVCGDLVRNLSCTYVFEMDREIVNKKDLNALE